LYSTRIRNHKIVESEICQPVERNIIFPFPYLDTTSEPQIGKKITCYTTTNLEKTLSSLPPEFSDANQAIQAGQPLILHG
jgi:hypothetical protein